MRAGVRVVLPEALPEAPPEALLEAPPVTGMADVELVLSVILFLFFLPFNASAPRRS